MKFSVRKKNSGRTACTIFIIVGITINVLFAYLTYKLDLPLYFDTIGTFAVSILGGYFPGALTAVITNMMCIGFNPDSIYFGLVNATVAILTAGSVKKRKLNTIKNIACLGIDAAILSGIIGGLIQWRLFGQPQNSFINVNVNTISSATGISAFAIFMLVSIITNIPDKLISLLLALAFLRLLSEDKKQLIKNSNWRQRPLSDGEREIMRQWGKGNKKSLRTKLTIIMVGMSSVLVAIMFWVGIRLYYENMESERTLLAQSAANIAASVIDPDEVDAFLSQGEQAEGYAGTEAVLDMIRNNSLSVSYLYVFKASEAGLTTVFDLDVETEDGMYEGAEVGTFFPMPEYFNSVSSYLAKGDEAPPVYIHTNYGISVTAFAPVYTERGRCVCYAAAQVDMEYLSKGMRDFLIHIVLMMGGLLLLMLVYGSWVTGTNLVLPLNSIVLSVEKFISAGGEQKKMDEALKLIRSLDVDTDDEVEKLYYSISDMAANQTEQMRSLRRYTEATAKMQDGLIITMADLVENRDSDTGAHIQKMAAYVKIIVEGLKKKGYYAEKITPQFVSDIVRSAPLHDIGKINIPDNVLNKPGKLTPEEYEIMKTHTTAGEKIMAKAISTVEGENYLKEARNMATYHHERWDGKGYPEGLHGEVIPLSARITAVADVFDALTSPRVYKPAFPLEEALAMIQEGSGTQFDPKCVEVFMESLPEVKVILRKYNEDV